MNKKLYPLRFEPILKKKVWGGTKLGDILNKNLSSNKIGESWEISTVEDNISVVKNGVFKGKTLSEIISSYKADLLGEKAYKDFGNAFPLLIKFIDAEENLSVQLHPNDVLAKERHDSFGKTEMWYILQADEGSGIIAGFKDGVTKEDYLAELNNKKLPELLNFEKVKKGDTFFIKPGLIHAIGAGVLLAEIQQTSDITYRVYDWDRAGKDGEKRDLHTTLAEDAIDFTENNRYKIPYTLAKNQAAVLAKNNYFTTRLLAVAEEPHSFSYKPDSFRIFMAVEGETTLTGNGFKEILKAGETILFPAVLTAVTLSGNNSKVLEVSI
ncbi:type I phosphomannose isomerase catalytic subunit [Haloflavibacter putidus]|uniref:Phosphohexomutase n=1 Tax=Haloflavibacter putidus TaxID=2576776 RepID=A0A507ZQA5_9FLAO|nr:type I phosphomannose isomerase catalytic subunit [Haloflavibacter putidus]TQD38771.1 mannose-6-phosphate isomerase [Haloflavibacter putidus]